MPGISRIGDAITPEPTFGAYNLVTGSSNVLVNGIGACTVGDASSVHCNPVPVCHSTVVSAGSSTVFINGKAAARIGDPCADGGIIAEGSSNVIAG